MDEAAREVLKKLKPEIKRNLILDDEILDTLEANDTLTSDHVEKIKAEKTNSEKISTLLFILQRKGPSAFQAFIDAIKPEYEFLAEKLLDRYQEEERKLDKDSGNSSEASLEPTENPSPNIDKEVASPVSNNQANLPNVDLKSGHTIHRSQGTGVTNSNFLQDRHAIRRPSNHALDLSVHPTNHFIHTNHSSRRQSSHSIDFATHQSLNGMYTKLKMHLFHINEREQSFSSSPVPVNFEMVEDLLDKLLKLEQDCYKLVGANNKDSLLTSIVNLKLLKGELQKNLYKKEEQIQKYALKILKWETKCKNNEITMKQQENAIETLRLENKRLNEENETLREEVSRIKHTEVSEEEIQLKNVRQVSKQNEELRRRISRYEKELEMMTLKFNTVNQQLQNQENEQASVLTNHEAEKVNESGKKKDNDVKEKVPEKTTPVGSTISTLQECKDLCAGTNSKTARHNLQQMRTKILFAESKRNGSKKLKDSGESNELLERMAAEDKMAEQVRGQVKDELHDSRRQYYRMSNSYETMAELATNKQSVTQSSVLKQKSSTQLVKKPVTYRGLKKTPRWLRKPLR